MANPTRFQNVFVLHGKGGSPEGSSRQLQSRLEQLSPELEGRFQRPWLLHSDPSRLADDSFADLQMRNIPEQSLLIGISLGGLLAAKLQECGREDVCVICISSPTWADGVALEEFKPNRIAFYSSKDEVISGRTSDWPRLAEAHDLYWLTHDTDKHADALARLILDSI